MLKWRCVLITKSGRKFVVRGFDNEQRIKFINEIHNTLKGVDCNTGGYVTLSSLNFRVSLSVSELDCIIWRKTIFGW